MPESDHAVTVVGLDVIDRRTDHIDVVRMNDREHHCKCVPIAAQSEHRLGV